jgi:hypothetical protein
VDIRSRPTALSTTAGPFIPFDGRGFVEVDADGIFISMPIPPNPNNPNASSNSDAASSSRKIRRGLHIASSEGLLVSCTQPVSLILSIPIVREAPTPAEIDANGGVGRIVLPWSYIRELNPIRASNSPTTAEQIEEEELEASSFANTLMALEQLMAGLTPATTHIKICVSCGDRIQRDALACTIRGINCQPLGTTHEERLAVMPWNVVKKLKQSKGDNSAGDKKTLDDAVVDKANSIQELARRLKELELENAQLKKERYEIPAALPQVSAPAQRRSSKPNDQLATIAESSMENDDSNTAAGQASSSQEGGGATTVSTDDNENASSVHKSVDSQDSGVESVDQSTDGGEVTSPVQISTNSKFAASEATRMLSAKVLELEKKLAVSARREAEAVKLRQQVDQRTSIVATESERVKAAIIVMEAQTAEATAELASSRQICKDLKDTLERECEEHARARVLVRELDELRPTLVVKENTIKELTASLEAATAELEKLRPHAAGLEATLATERAEFATKISAAEERITDLESKVGQLCSYCC